MIIAIDFDGTFCIFAPMKVIYTIICKETNKQYIGSALNHAKRKREHFYNLKNNKHPNKKLQNAYNIYGADCFDFKIIEVVEDEKKLIEREQHYIDNLKPIYNICRVAGSSLGLKRTNDTRDKIRAANLGIKHPQWRNEIKSKAQGGENHWTKRKGFSNKSKKQMSATHKEKYRSGYRNPLKGTRYTAERIEAMRIMSSQPIIQYDLNLNPVKEWNSAKEAKQCGFIPSNISACINGLRKTHKKFIWKRK